MYIEIIDTLAKKAYVKTTTPDGGVDTWTENLYDVPSVIDTVWLDSDIASALLNLSDTDILHIRY